MKPHELTDAVRALLASRRPHGVRLREIAEALRLKGKDRKRLIRSLRDLEANGEIGRAGGDRYRVVDESPRVAGILSPLRSGDAIVTDAASGREVWVPERALTGILPGDNVEVKVAAGPSRYDRSEAESVRLVERTRRDIVGTLRSRADHLVLVPLDAAYGRVFRVRNAGEAKAGDRVIGRFAAWPNRYGDPEAEILEVIGREEIASTDTIAIVRHYGFRESFPGDVMREAETASRLVAEPGRRTDLRDEYILTIDPARARDFDDALSLGRTANGNRVLGVHIADVSHFVRRGGNMDREARRRGNSVYLPDKVIPMLPEQLSNGICSLKPKEDRLAFSVFLTVDDDGAVVSWSFARTVIRSRLRLTYEQVLPVLEPHPDGHVVGGVEPRAATLLRSIHALAQQMRRRRFAGHALDLDMPECEVVLERDGTVSEIRVLENDVSHQLIEECMVAANEAVAKELSRRKAPALYRVHAPPTARKMEALTEDLAFLGRRPGDLRAQAALARFLRAIQNDPLAHHMRVAVLRSMQRAVYSPQNDGHFGLAKRYYTHFTSPIRRYPDLVVHRALAAVLWGEERAYTRDEVAKTAVSCSETEQAADEAERDLVEIKKYRFLRQLCDRGVSRAFDAVVVKAVPFGLFVELAGMQIQGLVPLSAMARDGIRFDRRTRTLRGRTALRVGTRLRVKVSRVDPDQRQIDFVPAGAEWA